MASNEYSKEMVDLLMRMKKHLRSKYGITIALADSNLLDKLVELRHMDDPLLQGMLGYLMALAGPEWSERLKAPREEDQESASTFSEEEETSAPPAEEKKPIRYYRGQPIYADD